MTVEQTENLYKHALKNGGLLGGIQIALTVVAYTTGAVSFMASLKFIFIVFCIYIVWVLYVGTDYRKRIGGFISYKNAAIHGLIVMGTAGFTSMLFGLLLYNVIDPELDKVMIQAILTNTEETMRMMNAPEDAIDKTLSDLQTDMPENFTPGGMVWNYVKSFIWYAILASVTGLVVRRNEPQEL